MDSQLEKDLKNEHQNNYPDQENTNTLLEMDRADGLLEKREKLQLNKPQDPETMMLKVLKEMKELLYLVIPKLKRD